VVDDTDASPPSVRPDESPDESSDEQPLDESTDREPDREPEEEWQRPIDRFRRSSAGTVIAAGLLGVRDALEGRPEREEPAIVTEAPEPKLDHIDLVLDPEHPERSRAIVYLPPRDESREEPSD
jgi:hypothetical protein